MQDETIKEGNRKEEPCHTATVNLKYQAGVGIIARGFKSVVALTVTSQRQVTILAISQVSELNWLKKKREVKIQENNFSFFY